MELNKKELEVKDFKMFIDMLDPTSPDYEKDKKIIEDAMLVLAKITEPDTNK